MRTVVRKCKPCIQVGVMGVFGETPRAAWAEDDKRVIRLWAHCPYCSKRLGRLSERGSLGQAGGPKPIKTLELFDREDFTIKEGDE